MKKVLFLFVALMVLSTTSEAQLKVTFGSTGKHAWIKGEQVDSLTKKLIDFEGFANLVVVTKLHKIRFDFDASLMTERTITAAFANGKVVFLSDFTIPDGLRNQLIHSSGITDLPKAITAGTYNVTRSEKNGKVILSIVTK